jgi:hypothetical protein
MGTWYTMVNFTKNEKICFAGLSGMKAMDIVNNPEGATLAAFYMLSNREDEISFVPDDAPFRGRQMDHRLFTDVTERYIQSLVDQRVFVDCGIDPETNDRIVKHWIKCP